MRLRIAILVLLVLLAAAALLLIESGSPPMQPRPISDPTKADPAVESEPLPAGEAPVPPEPGEAPEGAAHEPVSGPPFSAASTGAGGSPGRSRGGPR